MIELGVILFLIFFCFAFVLLFGAPYLPTLKPQIATFIEAANLKPGETILELGSGDGRVLLAAARAGLNATGFELNPVLALLSYIRTFKYRKQVRIVWGNFWTHPWPEASVIFVFLLPKYMEKLDKKIIQYNHKPIMLVSFAFKIQGKKTYAQKNNLYLYKYN